MPDPRIPEKIVVHLGAPDSDAQNVTESFADYIKNVASSEIFPTWPEAALRANILAQISVALNRVYTEFYRSRGYNFDITNSPAYDQTYVFGRDIFGNISELVDEIFNSYIRREEFIEPLFATFCDGVEVSCDGLLNGVALLSQIKVLISSQFCRITTAGILCSLRTFQWRISREAPRLFGRCSRSLRPKERRPREGSRRGSSGTARGRPPSQ